MLNFVAVLVRTKASQSVAKAAASSWRAPVGDFIVSDDDLDESSGSDIEPYDYASPPQIMHSAIDKENGPAPRVPDVSSKATRKQNADVNAGVSATNLAVQSSKPGIPVFWGV